MARKIVYQMSVLMVGLGLLMGCGVVSPESSFVATHPQELGAGRPMCADCHGDEVMKGSMKPYSAFNHTPDFVKNHRFLAGSDGNTCAVCHAPSFCADCHGAKTVMKPATKLGERPDRMSPHRGDWMTLHKMEGMADPSSCYQCHGRANNDKCRACHQ
jgi:hypothetical protein